MAVPRQKFFYKLCASLENRIYCYMQKNVEFSVGQTITQDIAEVSPYLYVYKTQELAISSEILYKSKDIFGKISQKTVVKLMCWGDCLENAAKFAFSKMCVVENLGFPKGPETVKENNNSRASSRSKWSKVTLTKKKASPQKGKIWSQKTPMRLYSSTFARKKSPKNLSPIRVVPKKMNVNQILRKMKEETDRLDQEVKDIERWNDFSKMEDMESFQSMDLT